MTGVVIGHIDVEARTIRDQGYSTASWYRDFECPAQRVEVTLSSDGRYAFWTLQGRDVFESFPSSFGGHQTGGGPHGPVDRPSTHTVQTYGYRAAAMVEEGRIELLDGWSIAERIVAHPVFCMGYRTVYDENGTSHVMDCGCPYHVDGSGRRPAVEPRTSRGYLTHGYMPDRTDQVRHISIERPVPAA